MDEREEYERCKDRGTHNEKHSQCVECGYEYSDFPEPTNEQEDMNLTCHPQLDSIDLPLVTRARAQVDTNRLLSS